MIKIVKIASKLFPDRYKKYTNFDATYGCVGIYEDGSVMLFLDPRYYASAQAAGMAFKPLKELPREKCILDPFEWTINEFASYQFVDPVLQAHEEYQLAENIELGHLTLISNFLEQHPGKKYLLTNINTIKQPTYPLAIDQDGVVTQVTAQSSILFDPDITPIAYANILSASDTPNVIVDPIRADDAIVYDIDGYKKFLLNDAIAWMKFWQKIEALYDGITEQDAAQILESERRKIHGKQFACSFETIAECNENAAKIHARASEKMLEEGVLLVDAGSKLGEYTSDITRVFKLGSRDISHKLKAAYTKVLQAHIAVATHIFTKTAPASVLDEVARKYTQFDHALGHAVGKDDVHAYPAIRSDSHMPLRENMIIAIEPGFYMSEQYGELNFGELNFGIRLESLMRVMEHDAQHFKLEYLVFIPFEYDLIDHAILNETEHAWLSKYHQICYDKLKEHVDDEFIASKTIKFTQ